MNFACVSFKKKKDAATATTNPRANRYKLTFLENLMSLRSLPMLPAICALATSVLLGQSLAAMDYVWFEGETPSAQSGGLADQHMFNSPHAKLSGGRSLGGTSAADTWLEYTVEIPANGDYNLYPRKFWQHGPFKIRWDGKGEWFEVKNTPLLDTVQLNDHCINWTTAGSAKLSKGKHTLRVESLEAGKPFVIDCFVAVNAPFTPNGLLKPGEKFNLFSPGWWSFEPDADGFTPDALNLRGMNEAIAGEKGWVKVDKAGDFTDGAGKPLRFWAANTGVQNDHPFADVVSHAKHLAKRGINLVRFHSNLVPDGQSLTAKASPGTIDALQKLVAACKGQGIYTTWSPYWAGHGAPAETLLFWDENVQAAYKRWIKEALTAPNPYEAKKTPVGKDPALAIFQIQNEDSFFFWTTMAALKDERLAKLTVKYHAWRAKNKLPGTPDLDFKFWEMGNAKPEQQESMRFFAETQHAWNTEVARFLREDCGCKAVVNPGNWRTADQVHLLDLERWSYSANEVIGVNRYVGGVHVNPSKPERNGYAVDVGDLFTDISKTIDWEALATNARQVQGKAYIIPESTWVPPGTFSSEGPLLVAAYSALNGVDAFYWFALGGIGYDTTVNKWQAASPTVMGGWPAASFLFRKGLVKRGTPALIENRPLEDLWQLRAPLLAEEAGFDPNRDTQISPRSNVKSTIKPHAYLVGPVEVAYGADPAKSQVADLAKFIDETGKKVTSNTDELVMNYGTGLFTINAPAVQGATGFLAKAGTITLKTLTISAKNDYATVIAVALDEKPLAHSKKVLVQITTRNQPYGWKVSPSTFNHEKKDYDGFRIDDVGSAPWNVADADMTVTLGNSGLKKVTRLDENLYPTTTAVTTAKSATGLAITVPKNAMYLLVE